jgi:SAM-dependent methyltransferase
MRRIGLDGFEQKFVSDNDPWSTFSNRDEARKRNAILRALGPGPWGRILELGAGNGSNSVAIAARALRLDATEATAAGTDLVARALADADRGGRARASQLIVPARFPRACYDGIVVAELLYYLTPCAMAETARDVGRALAAGGTLVLAHHRIDFYDFVQHAAGIHARFLQATGLRWTLRVVDRTGDWVVLRAVVRSDVSATR